MTRSLEPGYDVNLTVALGNGFFMNANVWHSVCLEALLEPMFSITQMKLTLA